MSIPDLSTASKLADFLKQHPPQSADFREFGRAVLIHLRMKEKQTELLSKKVDKLGEALKAMAEMLVGNADADEEAASIAPAAAPGSPAAVNTAPTTPTSTPFPAGVKWKAEDATAAASSGSSAVSATAAEAPGADEEEGDVDERGIPKPDTVARVVSVAPIAPKPTGNGVKPSAS